MRKYYGITAPVWIFLLTLLLIVFSGSIAGGGSCERALDSCESEAIEAHPDDPTLQQAYVSRCTASACSSGKRAAIVPFSILALGVVLYVVWLRTGDSSEAASPSTPPASVPSEPAAVRSDVVPASRQAAAPEPPSPTPPVPSATPAQKAQSSLVADDNAVYLDEIRADGEPSKEELAQGICRLTGISDVDRWKSAPADDLALLKRVIATAAVLSPADSKYRSRTGTPSSDSELDTLTKKSLQQHCIDVLRADLLRLANADVYPQGLSKTSVRETIEALDAADALAGLSRLSKSTLVALAGFLGEARA